jgi:hypothetical protein
VHPRADSIVAAPYAPDGGLSSSTDDPSEYRKLQIRYCQTGRFLVEILSLMYSTRMVTHSPYVALGGPGKALWSLDQQALHTSDWMISIEFQPIGLISSYPQPTTLWM